MNLELYLWLLCEPEKVVCEFLSIKKKKRKIKVGNLRCTIVGI